MYGIHNYEVFILAGILLNMTPGTDTMYIIGRSAAQGKMAGVYSALGIGTGSLVHTLLAAFGLSVVLAQSIVMFNMIKIIGVIYLFYLGLKMILSKATLMNSDPELVNQRLSKVYLQGVLTNVFNPKVALFYLSFLPQFVDATGNFGPIPFVLLGLTFIVTGTLWNLLLAFFSSFATKKLRSSTRAASTLNKLTGIVFIAMGVKLFQAKASQ
ncbi:homoserine lactone transporter [Cohnella kolymensis]|uniref:Homoserine lactone transporter n=1 Tax=Cohnella kolymensis TaxID=1590652 RepID=A0ABR5A1U1_9BACL|nr:LysE family translocator [Cohnella kolymensis]KIL35014.1 homoserine lactone transporter [Cohnella kolymensis]